LRSVLRLKHNTCPLRSARKRKLEGFAPPRPLGRSMGGSRKDSGPSLIAALTLVTQLGLAVATPIVLCAVLGHYLDERLNAGGLVLALSILLGVASGIYSAFRLIGKVLPWKF